MADDKKPKDYAVGYKRPPKHSQFKPGVCPNPSGRPKGSRNFSTEIEAELNVRTPITEQGKRKKISKRKVVAKQLVNKAASGDVKATSLLLEHERRREASRGPAATDPAAQLLTPEDQLVMESIKMRIRSAVDAPPSPKESTDQISPPKTEGE